MTSDRGIVQDVTPQPSEYKGQPETEWSGRDSLMRIALVSSWGSLVLYTATILSELGKGISWKEEWFLSSTNSENSPPALPLTIRNAISDKKPPLNADFLSEGGTAPVRACPIQPNGMALPPKDYFTKPKNLNLSDAISFNPNVEKILNLVKSNMQKFIHTS